MRGANKKGLLCLSQIEQGEPKNLISFEKGLSLLTLCKNCTQPGTVQTVSAGNFRISLLEETL